ncbi:MAG TPA: hypothetical protein DCM28_05035 [Phycisphaerales bacterium]|nr:hypothetical protein [Phycisphaerales bacterium]|tara:strand:+ start:9673 stop:10245 length:573 start_codon:yes stop_codon:yes gene_type:complete
MKKTSVMLSLAFVLVFAAGVTVGTVSRQHHKPPKDFGAFLAEKLDLTAQQQTQMKSIWSNAMKRDKNGRSDYKELRDQRDAAINALLGTSQMVEYQAIIDTYKDQFNKLRQSRRDAIDNAVAQTRKILTPKQLELYDKMRPDRKDGWRKPHYDHKPDRRPDNHSPKGAPGEGPASEDQTDVPEPPIADQD